VLSIDKLPADHLYKFLTFFGIVLFSLSYFVDEKTFELQKQIVDLQYEIKNYGRILKYEAQKAYDRYGEIKDYNATVNEFYDYLEKNMKNLSKRERQESKKVLKEISKTLSAVGEEVNVNKEKDIENSNVIDSIESKIDKLEISLSYIEKWSFFSGISQVMGIIIFFGGIFLWYFKIQEPLDRQARCLSLHTINPVIKYINQAA
jgi:hypothetical protein